MEQTREAGALSDGGGAAKAKSQQIHLLSPAISQRNWRQFVSFGWQQIWKHYVKKPSGKTAVCVMTEIYKRAKVIKRGKNRNNWVRQTCYSAGLKIKFLVQKKILFVGIWCHVILNWQHLQVLLHSSACSQR